MIPAQTNRTVQSTVEGEKIAMGFDKESLIHLMGILTDLYADPEMAVIREYSTNARDSHIEAGQTRPIEVTLPTTLAPFLTIKDYGIGMNQGDIRDTYSQYGASTKRDTNEQTGSLGLGCKSALAYAQQFTLTGIKGGTKTIVCITRDEDGAGSMTIVSSEPTDEPNGVQVVIPVRRFNSMEEKAFQFFRFWDSDTVLVNGASPPRLKGLTILPGLVLVGGEGLTEDTIVMGGVPYPVDRAIMNSGLPFSTKLCVYVEMGEVEFVPSREALKYTRRTKDRIAQIRGDLTHMVGAINCDVAEASNHIEALKRAVGWRSVAGKQLGLLYQGDTIPHEFNFPFIVVAAEARYGNSHTRADKVTAAILTNTLFIHGYGTRKFTKLHRDKIEVVVKNKGIDPKHYILTDPPFTSPWIDTTNSVPWEEVSAVRLPKPKEFKVFGKPKRLKGSYDLYRGGRSYSGVAANEIDTTGPVLHYVKKDVANLRTAILPVLKVAFPDYTLVGLPRNRVNKFCRDFPCAKELRDGMRERYNELLAKATEADRLSHQVVINYYAPRLRQLDPTRIDDPELVTLVKIAKGGSTVNPILLALYAIRTQFDVYGHFQFDEQLDSEANRMVAYPLMLTSHEWNQPHMYVYLNAAYAADAAGKES